ncbi:MAG: hypothetical protein IPJ24_04055 [bacterium]|nr:hypothetical protein [bacterium]
MRAPHPKVRALATALAIAAALASRNLPLLLVPYALGILPLVLMSRKIGSYLRLISVLGVPVVLALVMVWGVLVAAPPNEPPQTNAAGGALFGLETGVRIMIMASIAFLGFAAVSPRERAPVFRGWGLRGDMLGAVLGAFALVPELGERADQVITARYARGLIGRARWYHRLVSLPRILRPLIAWSLRSAMQRAELWEHRRVIQRLEIQTPERRYGRWESVALVGLVSAWLAWSLAVLAGVG